jgi:hypothetical protein
VSSPSERAALRRRAKLDSDQAEIIRAGIIEEREKAIDDAESAAQEALTLAKPVVPKTAPLISNIFRSYLEDESSRDENGQTRLVQIIQNLVATAVSGSPKSIAAAQLLIEYGYGKPKPSDEALDAMAKGGVQIVYINAPEVPLAEERRALPATPEFIEAEFVSEEDENG